ncbi:hypothetical protein EAG_14036 [Camponotus floridanus]|uniref:Uncharacterized protein n=1 Tax=Camponotus floridanus TaxID=104421 RepID=E2AD86_CAMFO|nr:hypothetical protein EAG_14036 [Camponotus floridanus]
MYHRDDGKKWQKSRGDTPRSGMNGHDRPPTRKEKLTLKRKQNEALRFGPGGLRPSPLDATAEHGTRQLVGTRNPRAPHQQLFRAFIDDLENLPDSPPCAETGYRLVESDE